MNPSEAVLTLILLHSSSVQNAILATIGLLVEALPTPEPGTNLSDLSMWPMVPSSRIYNHWTGIGSRCDLGSPWQNDTRNLSSSRCRLRVVEPFNIIFIFVVSTSSRLWDLRWDSRVHFLSLSREEHLNLHSDGVFCPIHH